MSTRSAIIIEKLDGTARGVYCHFDGYPEHHAPILLKHYATWPLPNELVKRGGISVLDVKIGDDTTVRNFVQTADDCLFYHRDRGDELTIITGASWREVASQIGHNGHIYVYRCKGKSWHYATGDRQELVPLKDVRLDEEIVKNINSAG